ncbi:UNVERIFIED_CONTAM: hypothetical protein GTU68_020909, partial [Idotea baltica]|nr:hypothetical protein [Idotea baltica]
MQINHIKARIIFDSRGFPTLEAECKISPNFVGTAAVPSGASTGSKEAIELRDGDPSNYHGKGVSNALKNFNNIIAPAIIGKNFETQKDFDTFLIELDGTTNKSKLGANAILAASLSFAKAVAKFQGVTFFKSLGQNFSIPKPMMNILNGGAHADNTVEIQEFMIMPLKFNSFLEAMKIGTEIFHTLKSLLKKNGLSTNVGDEGGFAPNLETPNQAIEYILEACEKSNYTPGKDVTIALDCAANEFYKNNLYY